MIDPNNYGDGSDDAGSGMPFVPAMPSAEVSGAPSIADQMMSQYPLRHGPAPYVGISPGSYGDQQALMTQNRASYGGYSAGLMSGFGALGGGIRMGASNLFSDMGSFIRPIGYTPPAHMMTGYSGHYIQQTGFFKDLGIMSGYSDLPRGARPSEVGYSAASDMGERVGLTAAGVSLGVGTLTAAHYLGKALKPVFSRALGGGMLMGATATLAAPIAGFYATAKGAEEVYNGISARRDISGFLESSSDRFFTTSNAATDPRRDGMSPGARRGAAEFIRGLDIKDPLISGQELSTILKDSTQLGLFAGTRDMDDFKRRFTGIVDNVKLVTKTLRQTLEEGLKTIKDLKGIGVDPSNAGRFVLGSEVAGRMAGRTASEMVNMGLQGAELFRGTGVSMSIGFQATQMNLASVRAARDSKMLSDEAVAQAGGEEALAQRLTANGLQHAQSGFGRGFNAYYFNKGMGTSGFNQGAFMGAAASGGVDFASAAMQAAENISTPGAMMKYQAQQEQINSQMGKMFGGQGLQINQDVALMSQAAFLQRVDPSLSMEDAFMLSAQQSGLDPSSIAAKMAGFKNARGAFESAQRAAQKTRDQQTIDAAGDNFFYNTIGTKAEKFIKEYADVVAVPLYNMVEHAKEGVANYYERDMRGISRYDVTGTGYKSYMIGAGADAGGKIRNSDAGVNLGREGFLQYATIGENLESLAKRSAAGDSIFKLNLVEVDNDKSLPVVTTDSKSALTFNSVLDAVVHPIDTFRKDVLNKKRGFASESQLREQIAAARIATIPLSEAQAMVSAGDLKDEMAVVDSALMTQSKKMRGAKNISEASRIVFGRDLGSLTRKEGAALLAGTVGALNEGYDKSLPAARADANLLLEGFDFSSTEKIYANQERAKAAKAAIEAQLNGGGAIPGEALAVLSELRGAKPEQRGEIRQRLIDTLMASGGRNLVVKADEFMSKTLSGSGDLAGNFSEFSNANTLIGRGVMARGGESLRDAFLVSVNSATQINAEEKQKLIGISSMLSTPESMARLATAPEYQKEREIIQRSNVDVGVSGTIKGLAEASTGKMPQADVKDLLERSGVASSKIGELVASYGQNNTQQVVQAVTRSIALDAGGPTGVAAQSGASNANSAATPQDAYSVQTQINMQVLSIMSSFASRLSGGR